MNATFKRQLQRVMSTEDWTAVEVAFDTFCKENFFSNSIRRGNEFDTIWYAAEQEGAKKYLVAFMKYLEDNAKDAQ